MLKSVELQPGKGRRRRRGIEIDDRSISAWRLVCHWHMCCVEY